MIEMWEVYALRQPYEGEPLMKVMSEIIAEQRRLKVKDEWAAGILMQRCWAEKPSLRPTINQVASSIEELEEEYCENPGALKSELTHMFLTGGEVAPDIDSDSEDPLDINGEAGAELQIDNAQSLTNARKSRRL